MCPLFHPHSTHSHLRLQMPRAHLSYTAMTGLPVVGDVVLRSIIGGSDLTVFANLGAFKEHHLRVLVTMPRTPLYVIKMVAREPGTNPARAIDYCSSGTMARALIKICRDVSCFSFYNQEYFVQGGSLHDFRRGADRFRRRDVVYEVLCERVLYGGDVLPAHVAKWFNNYGQNMHWEYMLKNGSPHMRKCYDVYERQAFEDTQELQTPSPYQFMIAYHRYIKFLPIKMYLRAVSKNRDSVEQVVKDMVDKGFSTEQVQVSLACEEVAHMTEYKFSVEGKKKKRKFTRATRSSSVRQLLALSRRIFHSDDRCRDLILSFL